MHGFVRIASIQRIVNYAGMPRAPAAVAEPRQRDADRSRLPDEDFPDGRNAALGLTALAGERVWDVQSKFRVAVGPLTYAEFRRFMPDGDG